MKWQHLFREAVLRTRGSWRLPGCRANQECRFDKILEWRSPDSDSRSPARNLAVQQRQNALRTLIGAVVGEEFELRTELDKLESDHRSLSQEVARLEWATNRLRFGLVQELGLDPEDLLPGRMAVEPLDVAAKASLARLARIDPDAHAGDLDVLRSEFDGARQRVEAMQSRQSALQERIPEIENLLSRIRGEMPGASVRANSLASPICPVCEVPIDRALAEGCRLSHKLPSLEEARRRLETLNAEHADESRRLAESRQELARTRRELESARRHAGAARQRLREVERVRDARSDAWFRARRAVDDVARLDQLLVEHERAQSRAGSMEEEIQSNRDRIAAFRDAQADVFSSLSRFFNAIIRAVMDSDAVGKISFDGSGLKASVELGGERSTAAIDSLKVIAFDLAVLCMSIEGCTNLPAFLVHDSPREADLGLSVYHRLFDLARHLEGNGWEPIVPVRRDHHDESTRRSMHGALVGRNSGRWRGSEADETGFVAVKSYAIRRSRGEIVIPPDYKSFRQVAFGAVAEVARAADVKDRWISTGARH